MEAPLPTGRGRVAFERCVLWTLSAGCYQTAMCRRVLLAAVLWAGSASAGELRAGVQYAGHLLFTDVAAAEVQWTAVRRGEASFFRQIVLESGVALSFDGRFVEVPALARFEVYRWWKMGLELAPGILLSHDRGTSAATAMLCAGLPFTQGRVRIQPEWCMNAIMGPPGPPTYVGGMWTGLGIGAFYAF